MAGVCVRIFHPQCRPAALRDPALAVPAFVRLPELPGGMGCLPPRRSAVSSASRHSARESICRRCSRKRGQGALIALVDQGSGFVGDCVERALGDANDAWVAFFRKDLVRGLPRPGRAAEQDPLGGLAPISWYLPGAFR